MTDEDKLLLETAETKKDKFTKEINQNRTLWIHNENNDYPFFLYLASILNFSEYHNEGCLTELGMKSLAIDVSPYITRLQTGEPKLSQKDLVRFLLNLLNSYATSFLAKGLFEFSKEQENYFDTYPSIVKDDAPKIVEKLDKLLPILKQVLDTYTPMLDKKYQTIFLQEKTKGFYKPIFDPNALKIKSGGLPSNLSNAKECK